MSVWSLRGQLPRKQALTIEVGGALTILLLWWFVVQVGWANPHLLPSPISVIASIPKLHMEDALVRNALFSIKLNMLGYLEAVAIALPVGMVIGLLPLFRHLFERYFTALRFLPLPAAMGIFIQAFGIYTNMKVQFLTVAILVYVIPAVITRTKATSQVYVDMAKTLGASRWQRVKTIFIPDVLASVFDDIRNLIALSWTYITINEVVNMGQGGLGTLANNTMHQGHVEKTYAVLFLIICIGLVQDRLLGLLDRKLFPFKYA